MKEEPSYGEFLTSIVEVPIKKAAIGDYAQGSPGNYPFMVIMCKILKIVPDGFIVENKAEKDGTWLFTYNNVLKCFKLTLPAITGKSDSAPTNG